MAEKQTSEIFFQADVSEFTRAISQMKSDMTLINSEFEASSSALDDWSKDSEGLEMKLKQLNSTLSKQEAILAANKSKMDEYKATLEKNKQSLAKLKTEYDAVVEAEGDNSKSAKILAQQIAKVEAAITRNEKAIRNEQIAYNKQKATVNKTKKEIDNYEKEVKDLGKELKNTDKGTKKLSDSTSKFGSNIKSASKGVASAIVAIAAAAAGAATSFLALAESTREYREDINKLQTAFKTAGHTTKQATDTYKELYSVIGEEDRSVEAAQQIAKLAKSEEEMVKMTNIATGVWGTFGDSLPVEGLMENINATAKIGSVQGVLADALEWSGINLDTFNQELEGMSSEEERAAHITNILNGLYSDAADNYRTLNKDIIEVREAQSRLTDSNAKLGAVVEPIVTILKNGLAKVLEYITPLVSRLANAFELLLSKGNEMTGLQRLGDIFLDLKEKAGEMLVGLVDGLANIIPQLLPKIVEFLGQIVSQFVEFAPTLLNAAIQLFTALVEAIPPTITALLEQLPLILDSLVGALNEMIPALLEGAIQVFSTLVDAIPIVIEKLVEILPQIIETISNFLQENLPIILEASITLLHAIVEALPVIISALLEALPTIINTIVDFVVDNLPVILDAGIQLLMELIHAIPVIIGELLAQLPTIIATILQVLFENMPLIWAAGFELLMEIVKAIPSMIVELLNTLPIIGETIEKELEKIDLLELGENIIGGLIDGIEEGAKSIWGTITDVGNSIVSGFESFFNIKSPSKLMRDKIGTYLGEGVALGIGDGFDKDIDKIKKGIVDNLAFDDVNATGNVNLSSNRINTNKASGNNIVLNYTVNSPSQLSRREIYIQAKKMQTILGGVS